MTAPPGEPWVRYEDEDLLVVAKPAGVTTHRADVHAQDGMYEWVQDQRPDVHLALLHRLDKATSGLLVLGKSAAANQALASQFENRTVAKRYEVVVRRADGRPRSQRCDEPVPGSAGDLAASTDFVLDAEGNGFQRWTARPHTGRTHQVRRHAAALGMPVAGDAGYGGQVAARLFLHAAGLAVDHPDGKRLDLDEPRPPSFDRLLEHGDRDSASMRALVALEARTALFDPRDTDAHLWIDRDHDGFPDLRVERLGEVVLAVRYGDAALPEAWVAALDDVAGPIAVYEQSRTGRGAPGPVRLLAGRPSPRFEVTEHGLRYRLDLEASRTSTGLFLDQRETRRRLRRSDLTGRTVLNTFAHTGSLSVAAAAAGAETLTLDLSKRYLDWAADNLRANDLDPAAHDFIYGDAMDWMRRLANKGRRFDLVLVDPPSTSTPRKGGGRWSVTRDLHTLVDRAARLCAPGGTIYVSTNHRRMGWDRFLDHVARGLDAAGREATTVEPRTLPLDHRSGPGDPPYLKAAWLGVD